jgi:hypothetical protein
MERQNIAIIKIHSAYRWSQHRQLVTTFIALHFEQTSRLLEPVPMAQGRQIRFASIPAANAAQQPDATLPRMQT